MLKNILNIYYFNIFYVTNRHQKKLCAMINFQLQFFFQHIILTFLTFGNLYNLFTYQKVKPVTKKAEVGR